MALDFLRGVGCDDEAARQRQFFTCDMCRDLKGVLEWVAKYFKVLK